jgi:hypothetical protein
MERYLTNSLLHHNIWSTDGPQRWRSSAHGPLLVELVQFDKRGNFESALLARSKVQTWWDKFDLIVLFGTAGNCTIDGIEGLDLGSICTITRADMIGQGQVELTGVASTNIELEVVFVDHPGRMDFVSLEGTSAIARKLKQYAEKYFQLIRVEQSRAISSDKTIKVAPRRSSVVRKNSALVSAKLSYAERIDSIVRCDEASGGSHFVIDQETYGLARAMEPLRHRLLACRIVTDNLVDHVESVNGTSRGAHLDKAARLILDFLCQLPAIGRAPGLLAEMTRVLGEELCRNVDTGLAFDVYEMAALHLRNMAAWLEHSELVPDDEAGYPEAEPTAISLINTAAVAVAHGHPISEEIRLRLAECDEPWPAILDKLMAYDSSRDLGDEHPETEPIESDGEEEDGLFGEPDYDGERTWCVSLNQSVIEGLGVSSIDLLLGQGIYIHPFDRYFPRSDKLSFSSIAFRWDGAVRYIGYIERRDLGVAYPESGILRDVEIHAIDDRVDRFVVYQMAPLLRGGPIPAGKNFFSQRFYVLTSQLLTASTLDNALRATRERAAGQSEERSAFRP